VKIFVTGGNGFLGKRLVRQLLSAGHEVSCLVRAASDTPEFRADVKPEGYTGALTVIHGSLQQIDQLTPRIGQCDAVIHAAAAMTGGTAALFVHNVIATRQLIAAFPKFGAKRFVLVSSLGVYGTWDLRAGDMLDESCPLDPKAHQRDPYSYSKKAQEEVAWEAHRSNGLPLVVIRPGVIYGPGKGCLSSRIGLQFGSIMIKMGGRQRVPYTYVDNCAAAIAAAAMTPGIDGQAFNILDDDLPSATQLWRQYKREVEKLWVIPIPGWAIGIVSDLNVWYHRKSRGQLPAVLTRYKSASQWKPLKFSNAKAKKLLGWSPVVTFDEGLAKTFLWLRERNAAKNQPSQTAPAPLAKSDAPRANHPAAVSV
jgi:nucleoside-diphosphate-sugar epimerase